MKTVLDIVLEVIEKKVSNRTIHFIVYPNVGIVYVDMVDDLHLPLGITDELCQKVLDTPFFDYSIDHFERRDGQVLFFGKFNRPVKSE